VRLYASLIPIRSADQLRYNKRDIDLSRTIRLSGLSSGAKLELVQVSKSAGVVSVALQLPESEAQGVPNARLTDKFPSSTTLWLILRKFEAGVAGNVASKRNITARGVASTDAGAGQLYYERPMVQIMGRELTSFTDLQRTLAQLGFNSGSILLRLSFKPSGTPLEEAMAEIEGYFHSVDGSDLERKDEAALGLNAVPAEAPSQPPDDMHTAEEGAAPEVLVAPEETVPELQATEGDAPRPTTSTGRPLSVFHPPSNTIPVAAQIPHNPADFTPTVEHAHVHQRMLNKATLNKRLPSEKESEAANLAEQAKLASIKEVEIKIRMPDQSALSAKFGQQDTGAELYGFVRECLGEEWRSETFMLRHLGVKSDSTQSVVSDNEKKLLIRDQGLRGRVLLVFGWDDTKASVEARMEKNVLREDLRKQAKEYTIQEVQVQDDDTDVGKTINVGKSDPEGGEKKKGGVPKWLKGLAKK
jgi:tether containing UBX domain for GLUT4